MFSVGDVVVYKTNAVCRVEAIETPSFVTEKGKLYYKLKSLYSKGNETVYVPVDSDVHMRSIMTEEKANECLEFLKNVKVELFSSRQPALITAHFQNILSDCEINSSLRVLKEIYIREKNYAEQGKKLRQVEMHFLSIVEKTVSEELSIALDKSVDEIKCLLRQVSC